MDQPKAVSELVKASLKLRDMSFQFLIFAQCKERFTINDAVKGNPLGEKIGGAELSGLQP